MILQVIVPARSARTRPSIQPDAKLRGITAHSKAIIDACRPFAWLDRFPQTSALSHDEARAIVEKWGEALR